MKFTPSYFHSFNLVSSPFVNCIKRQSTDDDSKADASLLGWCSAIYYLCRLKWIFGTVCDLGNEKENDNSRKIGIMNC